MFSTEVKVVNLLATVRSKAGMLIGNLTRDDFALSEDGRPQTIRYFSRETNLPLTLGLMVDTSGSQRRVIDAERGACRRFLDQVVRDDKDQAFIMQFDSIVQMRQDLTSSVGRLEDALGSVDTESMRQLKLRQGGSTHLYDAVAVLRRMSNDSGGSFFQVSKKQPLDQIFEVLQQELRNQYTLGYVSDKPVTVAEFRSIQLAAKESDLIVQARHQYWTKP